MNSEETAKSGNAKLISTVAVIALLSIAGIIIYPKIFKKNNLENCDHQGRGFLWL